MGTFSIGDEIYVKVHLLKSVNYDLFDMKGKIVSIGKDILSPDEKNYEIMIDAPINAKIHLRSEHIEKVHKDPNDENIVVYDFIESVISKAYKEKLNVEIWCHGIKSPFSGYITNVGTDLIELTYTVDTDPNNPYNIMQYIKKDQITAIIIIKSEFLYS